MKLKKLLACSMAVLTALCIVGCRKNPDNVSSSVAEPIVQSSSRSYITLLYSAADTFNPYTVKTDINRQLCKLLYEPLVKTDNEFNPVYSIAKSVTTQGKTCVVALNSVKFSDGTLLTADDVVYSCGLAKASGSQYAAKLYEVASVSAANASTVEFKLTKADPYFENLLDFPIIKANSEKVTDSDSVVQPPIGSGRYKVAEDRLSLQYNPNFYSTAPTISQIRLINAPDIESVSHYVEIGAADMYYSDISDGNILRMSGEKLSVNLNNLIYIGVNQNYGLLAENHIRQALSSGINRSDICRNAYYNNAVATTGFFNPSWSAVKSVQNIQIEANSEITVENLEKIGYNRLNDRGERLNANGQRLVFSLLVNSENRLRVAAAQLIAAQLKDYGISISVVEKPYSAYLEALKKGEFQLFLGEVKLTENMDISSLVSLGGSAAYGLQKQEKKETADKENATSATQSSEKEKAFVSKSQQVVEGFYAGKNTITDIAAVLQTEMPIIPVCYRTGILFCNQNIKNLGTPSASDIFNSIETYDYIGK